MYILKYMYTDTQISVITSTLCAALFYSVKGGGAKFQCKQFEGGQNLNAHDWRGGGKFSVHAILVSLVVIAPGPFKICP